MQVNLFPLAILLLSSLDKSIKSNGHSIKEIRGGSFVPEEVDVRFLTRVRRKRSLESHDYHIVEVVRPNSKLEIHLTRSDHLLADNFVFIVKNGSTAEEGEKILEESNDAENCVYSGGVTGMTTDSIPITGEAVLSACNHHEGLTGVITTTEGQYLIQPAAAKSRIYQSFAIPGGGDGQALTIRHTVSVITEDDGKTNVRKCEGSIYAPDDPSVEQESPKVEQKPPDVEEKTPKVEQKPPKSENEPPKTENEPPKVEQEHPEDLDHEIPLLDSGLPTLPNPMDSSPEGLEMLKSKQNKVTSRQQPIVELAVFVEESSLAELEKKLSTKSSKTLKNYVIALVQQMALVYQRPSISPNIDFKLVRIEFLARNPAELHTHHGSVIPFLESFCAYASKQNLDGGWDHSMMFTGLDIRQGGSPAPVGVAFTRGMCKRQFACSIVEGGSFAASNVMAHEMGHSLGMDHDGEGSNLKCDNKAYVMAAIVAPDQVTWSTCSNENLNGMIQTLHKTKSSFHERGYCLGSLEKSKKSYKLPSKLPGEVYSADTQCKLMHPQYPKAVTKSMENRFMNFEVDVCKRLFCTDSSMMISYFAHPALEGTECMPGKWCRRGECVKK